MDQLKEFLRQCVKYRFWIVVGVSALMPLIAYFAFASNLQAEEKAGKEKAEGSHKGVKAFESGAVATAKSAEVVKGRNEVATKDKNAAWRKLYARQAPLLTWPPAVQDTIAKWGRQWPKDTATNIVDNAITEYIENYDKEVVATYKVFNPFDFTEGTGIVAAPPQNMLLQPAAFSIENPPSLGKVWAAQEKLWIQRTVLDVVAKVNEKFGAKDWDTAAVKQILELVVANMGAVDQRSLVKEGGPGLEEAPDIYAPGREPSAEDASQTTAAKQPSGGKGGLGEDDQANQMRAAMGGAMMGAAAFGGGAAGGAAEPVSYLKSDNPDQYFVVPVYLSVLVDQDRVPDLLVEFENSPMAIRVLDFELLRPEARVRKPVKGEAPTSGMGMGLGARGRQMMGGDGLAGGEDMMSMMMGKNAGAGSGGYGANAGSMANQMRAAMGGAMMKKGGRRGAQGGAEPKATGEAITENTAKGRAEKAKREAEEKKKQEEEEAKAAESKTADPFYNIVEVRITGQARFYKTPPETPAEPASPGAEPADDAKPADDPKKDAAAPAPVDASKAEPTPAVEAKKDEPKKDEAEKDEPKKDEAPAPKA